jgi:hypothetical protein
MHAATGLTEDEIIDLPALIYADEENCEIDPRPPSPGLYKPVLAGFPGEARLETRGYVGKGMITPVKKPAGRKLPGRAAEFNTRVNKIRCLTGHVTADFKAQRIMRTGCRRPPGTFDITIQAAAGLRLYQMTWITLRVR